MRRATAALVFEARPCGFLRRALFDGVAYWLDTIPDLDGSLHVTLTAVVGTRRVRMSQWVQVSKRHDEVHARGLIARRHAEVVKQLVERATA